MVGMIFVIFICVAGLFFYGIWWVFNVIFDPDFRNGNGIFTRADRLRMKRKEREEREDLERRRNRK